jgi:hypothetical protein
MCSNAAWPCGSRTRWGGSGAALIAARRADGVPVAVACRALGVSRAWFYQHKDGRLPPRALRRQSMGRPGSCLLTG